MKIISKIYKKATGGREGQCVDGETVSLSTRLSDHAVQEAYCGHKRDPRNIWKVIATNRFVPLGHRLGGYTTYEGTTVVFG